MTLEVASQDLILKIAWKKVVPTLFVRNMEETIKVSVELSVMFVLGMESQAIESEIVLSQVLKVSPTILQSHLVAQLSRAPLSVPLVVNARIDFMHSSLTMIMEVLLI